MATSSPRDVEFEVIRKDWNVYKLSDGAKLGTRLMLGKVTLPLGVNLDTTATLGFNTQNYVVAYVPQSMNGPSSGRPLTS